MVDIARARAERLRGLLQAARQQWQEITELAKEAYTERDWESLGYSNWDAYVAGEGLRVDVRLALPDRRQMAAELDKVGMSTRAIAAVQGVDQKTVVRDLASEAGASVEPRVVRGLDNRVRTYERTVGEVAADEAAPAQAAIDTAMALQRAMRTLQGLLEDPADTAQQVRAAGGSVSATWVRETAIRLAALADALEDRMRIVK